MAINGYLVHNLIHKKAPFFKEQINGWIKAFKKQKIHLKTVDNFLAYDEIKKHHPDFVLFWDKDISLMYELMNLGIKIFNNVNAISFCDDKAFTYSMLIRNRIPTPKTIVMPLTFYQNGLDHFALIKKKIQTQHISYPLIVKERCNSLGLGVYLIHDELELKKIIKTKWDKHLLIQEYINYEVGKDYRVYLINHEPQIAVTRFNKKDFRSNVHQGGKISLYSKNDEALIKIAIKASKALHLDFGAVDIIKNKNNKYLVLEVNSNARTISLDKLSKKNITDQVVKYILKNI